MKPHLPVILGLARFALVLGFAALILLQVFG